MLYCIWHRMDRLNTYLNSSTIFDFKNKSFSEHVTKAQQISEGLVDG